MTRRRAKFRRHSGKMIKLFKDLFNVHKLLKTSCTLASTKMRPHLKMKLSAFSLIMATSIWLFQATLYTEALEFRRTLNGGGAGFSSANTRQERARKISEPLEMQPDPMEPCYLANNRASETLTISESTPVGTIVGELMVNGDSSRDGNIELSIKMPGGAAPIALVHTLKSNGYASSSEALSRGIGAIESSSQSKLHEEQHIRATAGRGAQAKGTRNLGNLIDLMPPLSIETGTKRLILAKKLDRENLERYIQAGSFQSSYSSINSLSQASSGSLTVHIKCQLKEKEEALIGGVISESMARSGNSTSNTTLSEDSATKFTQSKKSTKSSNVNSILIPIHLIVTDENDNWPSFIGAPYIIDLNETAPVGSLLPGNEIVALDNDQQGPLSTIEYSIVPGSFYSDSFAFLNPLDARSLIVKDTRALDYEAQSKIQLKLMARDQGEPPNWAISSLFINLIDQDDLSPVFEHDQYRAEVKENRPGEQIELSPKRLLAHDGDKQLAAPVSYAFHLRTNHSIYLELDPDLGHLRLKKALPEQASEQAFCLLVRATQVDNEQRSGLTAIQLRLATKSASTRKFEDNLERFLSDKNHSSRAYRDRDEDASLVQFAQPNYALEMSESAPVGATVFTARAGRSPAISYQLLDNELGFLNIEPQTGRIKLNRSLDFELYRQVSVRILATLELNDDPSSIYPKLACDITRLQVNVLNFNEFKPEFSHEQYNFQLSISDLIANFEPQATRRLFDSSLGQELVVASGASGPTQPNVADEPQNRLRRRFGAELELEEDANGAELPDYRAIQLGQVYCADRDFGDKVTLSLSGNKANLFRLTQDGRLYLPLVNVTNERVQSQASNQGQSETTDSSLNINRVAWASRTEHQINNKFTLMSRPFSSTTTISSASRRNDPLATDLLDRNYLNYLLSEVGQLARLRLKVHASDEAQPTSKQSSALVVVSIISIDNFIIQRAQSHSAGHLTGAGGGGGGALGLPGSEASVQLTNSTSYQTGAGGGVMMIPSMDGRSFVHINPDIIGNLLATSQNSSSNAAAIEVKSKSASSSDSLEPAASSPVGSAVRSNESRRVPINQANAFTREEGKQQPPPSLLLVDDEGAKFVAMPAAIEVYQQQVQEAADQQTQRQKRLEDEASSSLGKSIWHFWGSKLNARADNGAIHWLNLSTAIMLHLVVVGAIVMLLTRFRSSMMPSGRDDHLDGHNSQTRGSSSDSDLWPRRLSRLSSYFGDKSTSADQAASILTCHQAGVARSSYGQPASPSTGERNHYAAFLGQPHESHNQRPLSPPFTEGHSKPVRDSQPEIVSSGPIVSAMSNKMQANSRPDGTTTRHQHQQHQQQQQNLFNHLKLTLNKMLDGGAEPATSAHSPNNIINQVSMRPLDSDVVAFEDMRDRELEVCAQLRETSELQVQQQRKMGANDEKAPVSTFVGATVSANNLMAQRCSTMSPTVKHRQAVDTKRVTGSKSQNGAVVSINVKGPAPSIPGDRPVASSSPSWKGTKQKRDLINNGHSSSNSSVISLVSMSNSSLSNKINEAVGRAGNEQANGSDASSLNSSILLNGLGDSSSCSSNGRRQTKPPAAPPLPAPPPSQMRVQLGSPKRSNKPTSGDRQLLEAADAAKRSPNLRQQPPENPVHVRLRRQALCELPVQSNAQEQRSTSPSRTIGKAAQQVAAMSPTSMMGATSVGGRREARSRATPPTPPPMPGSKHNSVQYLYGQAKSDGSKITVSPTTSVDRGYESFQSYSSNCAQQQRGRHQFHSLPECEPSGDHCAEPSSVSYSMPVHNQSRRQKLIGENRAPSEMHCDSPAECSPLPTTSSLRPVEGDTEDDDFYYCCNEPVHSSEVHQLSAGGLLSDYANHTYRQQARIGGQPSRTQQRTVGQSKKEPTASSSTGKSARGGQCRRLAEHNHTNTSNDLIPFCDPQLQQQHQKICDNVGQPMRKQHAPATNRIQRGRTRRSVATLRQSSQRPFVGYYSQQPVEQQAARPFGTSCVAFNVGAANGASNSNKKQLTWFDQVEVDFH